MGAGAVVVQAIYADGRTWTGRTETPVQQLHGALVSLEGDWLVYRACDSQGEPTREWVRAPGRGFVEVRP
jgi:hypothetical protein